MAVPYGGDYEEYSFLVCNAVYFGEIPTFRRNISPPSTGQRLSQATNEEKQITK
jgi:hypothetical protein